jgi:membrane-associated phospholipid phosphatase
VAFEMLVYLWMRRVSKLGSIAFAVCVILIFLGSVITGWHYLIDSIAGMALAVGCYAAVAIRDRNPTFPTSCLN